MKEHLDKNANLNFCIEKHHKGETKFLVGLGYPFNDEWDWLPKNLLKIHPVTKFDSEEKAKEALKTKLEREDNAYVKHSTINIKEL